MTTLDYRLRPATDDDYDFLYRLHVATMKESVAATWGWDEAFQAEYFKTHWNPAHRHIISVNNIDIGTLTVEERSDLIFLALIEIHPDYQGQGLGTRIIRQILADAQRRKLNVELHVLKTNPRARQLYERLGFVVTETRAERYVMTSSGSFESRESTTA